LGSLSEIWGSDTVEHMERIVISKWLNIGKQKGKVQQVSFADLRGALRAVKELKGKTSVEVQKMIPELWSKKNQKHCM
jgi:hypothetical protein